MRLIFTFLLVNIFVFSNAQTTAIPDANFEQALIDLGLDSGPIDGIVLTVNIDTIITLNVANQSISDLTGIEDFTALENLYCNNNSLTSLDVTQNSALFYLHCYNNQLTSLDVTQNTALYLFLCYNNQLTSLDVTQNSALFYFHCYNNQLTSLDVTQNSVLTFLRCYNNQLTSLDVTQNPTLANFYCNDNNLTSLDLTQNSTLSSLRCNNNQLTSLDVSQNTDLFEFRCHYNQITSLDVTQNTLLSTLSCSNNPITSIDVTQNTGLISLSCSTNQLTNLDVTQNSSLTYLSCNFNQLTILDLTQLVVLRTLWCINNQISNLELTQSPDLLLLYCSNNELTSLDVTQNPDLIAIQCKYNEIASLDVTQNTLLTNLYCDYNEIPSLDVSQNIDLNSLRCAGNDIPSLDVTQNVNLTDLRFSSNQISSIDVSQNTLLVHLFANDNLLTTLDITQNVALFSFTCYTNQLICLNAKNGNNTNMSLFNAGNNPNLTCIEVDDDSYSTINWTSIDPQSSFSTSCPTIDLGLDTEICPGEILVIGEYINPYYDFTWNDGSNDSTYNVTSAGTYWVNVSNGCGGIDSDSINVISLPLTTVEISNFNIDTICSSDQPVVLPTGTPLGGTYSGFGVSGANFDPILSGIGVHHVVYTYVDSNSCSNSDSTAIAVDVCTGMENLRTNFEINIFPNPTTGSINIDLGEVKQDIKATLTNGLGQVVFSENYISTNFINLDIDAPKGIYFLQLESDGEVITKKIIKE